MIKQGDSVQFVFRGRRGLKGAVLLLLPNSAKVRWSDGSIQIVRKENLVKL